MDKKLKIAYYPGCSLEATAKDYDVSLRAILPRLGVELVDIKDWNCCGATSAHSLNSKLALALPARVLALAETTGCQSIFAPCAACWHRLTLAKARLIGDPSMKAQVEETIEMPLKLDLPVVHFPQLLRDHIGVAAVAAACTHKLEGLRVASYYGCLMLKPPSVEPFENPENPVFLDELMKSLGATPVKWSFKSECCGGGLTLARPKLVARMTGEVLRDASLNQANAMSVACPMCQNNLDMRQGEASKVMKMDFNLPVLYVSQWIGLSMGMKAKDLGIENQFVNAKDILGILGKVSVGAGLPRP
jgi:heterodisulfide reductase subunit B